MSTVEEIERAVRELPPEELALFRAWFAEFDASVWDHQIEADVAAGRLDALAEEALQELREGRCTSRRSGASGLLG
jgi:hypothetical protein